MSREEILRRLSAAVLGYDSEAARQAAREGLAAHLDPLDLVENGLSLAMKTVGDSFARGELFLPELMMSARVFQAAVEILDPAIAAQGKAQKKLGKLLLGTVEGDIHDIGKNIVGILAGASGFQVVDLGTNVPAARFVAEVEAQRPDIVGMSAMLTNTRLKMGEVVRALDGAGLRPRVKVMVGGAVLTEAFAREIGADGYGANAEDAFRKMKAMAGVEG